MNREDLPLTDDEIEQTRTDFDRSNSLPPSPFAVAQAQLDKVLKIQEGEIAMKPEWLPKNPYWNYDSDYGCGQEEAYAQGYQDTLKAVIGWLEQPCTEHPYKLPKLKENQVYTDNGWNHHRHRKDCPQCWQELRLSL